MDRYYDRLKFHYDREADVLYSYLDHPRPAIGEEESSGIIIRYDINTKEIVGFTIINYGRRYNRLLNIPHFPGLILPSPDIL